MLYNITFSQENRTRKQHLTQKRLVSQIFATKYTNKQAKRTIYSLMEVKMQPGTSYSQINFEKIKWHFLALLAITLYFCIQSEGKFIC